MPALARKILICAAVDGLILQPLTSKKDQRPSSPVKIHYGDAKISPISRDLVPETSKLGSTFEAFGIVGLITVSKFSFLISITRRQQVATIRGYPIYVVSEVALTPCASQQLAAEAIAKTAEHLKSVPTDRAAEESESEDEAEPPVATNDDVGDESSGTEDSTARSGGSSVAQDVISRRGSYGRFAQSWFSKKGWMLDQKRSMGLSNKAVEQAVADDIEADTTASREGPPLPAQSEEDTTDSAAVSLLPKLLRTTQILFGTSRSFYFSYDWDITRSVASKHRVEWPDLPLHKTVDPLYFWNSGTLKPFTDAGMDSLALPLMQGFVGQRSFVVDSNPPQVEEGAKDSVEMSDFAQKPVSAPASPPTEPASVEPRLSEKSFDIVVISRRSVKRPGLRFLRRGVDEGGNVANSVETEQILSPSDMEQSSKICSFVQVRGSIPQFFKQTPYSLKPTPVLQHSQEANYTALKKHFDGLRERYSSVQVVNLVEKHGSEAKIGTEFEKGVQRLNEESTPEQQVPFEWFDFHNACRGMKFENISLLIDILGKKVETFGCTIETAGEVAGEQKGVFRTNCMDCLDRTNVCQSSFAKYMLDSQLKEQGFDMLIQRDLENSWFNTLWADNGDAVSKQYASTGAMKGDYTRTRKRNYRGALTDVGLSLTRLFNGVVNDFFLQTTIDFLLGNVTYRIFDEFEARMMTQDPAVSILNMREQAIELCQKRVITDEKEELVHAWTLLSPHGADSFTAKPFEEVVLMLTDAALYLCRFDWSLDKVSSFERVELAHIEGIRFGTYIISTISSTQMDEQKNVGFVVTYRPGSNDIMRVNTRSISSLSSRLRDSGGLKMAPIALPGFLGQRQNPATEKKMALKALYTQTSLAATGDEPKMTELQQVVSICAEIERLALLSKPVFAGTERKTIVEQGDIISLADAKKSTGLLQQWGHTIKKLVWA